MITDWTQRHDKHEAMRLIGGAGVPAGAVLDTGDLLGEPSFAKRGIIQTMQHQKGTLRMPAFPVRFDGAPAPVKPAPLLGEHTAEVFGEWLGMDAADVEGLRREGAV
jgi:formyl-CoA transferase